MKIFVFGLLLSVSAGLATSAPDQPKSSDSPVSPAAIEVKDGVPAGHKLLYAIARDKAATALAKKENISRAAAREKIAEIEDATLHAAVQASGITIAAQVSGGKLSDFIAWLSSHSEQIMAIVKIILALFGV